jgi:general secretion pathway protein F
VAAFEYVVLDTKGRQKKGTLEGDSARQVRQQLRDDGFVPISVESTVQRGRERDEKTGTMRTARGTSRHSLPTLDLSVFTRQLATLVQAGLPVEEALKAISKQSDKPKLRSIVLAVRSRVVEGHTLANGLAEFPRAFPEIYRATVAAGEHSGHLDLVLEQLADYTESSHDTTRKVKGALIYPIVLVSFSLLIVIGLLNFVVPKMVSVFESSGHALPGLTLGLIAVSEFIQNYGIYMLLLIVAAVFGAKYLLKQPLIRFRVHRVLLKMPVMGRLSQVINASRVANTLSILSRSGVQLVDALSIAAQVTTNVCIRKAVQDAAVMLREGSSLHRSLDQSGHFPPMLIQMIASGESSGELDAMLTRAARAQDRELQSSISTIVSLFEPLMMMFMGVVILVIVLAIMLPVISMNSLVS